MLYLRPVSVIALLLLPLLTTACAGKKPRAPQPQPVKVETRPVVDFSRGALGLPLNAESLPQTAEALTASLLAGYSEKVTLPGSATQRASLVQASGDAYPSLETLKIDLTGARVKGNYRPTEFRSRPEPSGSLRVGEFEYVAWPIQYERGKSYLRIAARDAEFVCLRGRDNNSTLTIRSCEDGLVDFRVTMADLRQLVLSAAKQNAQRAAWWVFDVQLKMVAPTSRSLEAEMRVKGLWLLLPTDVTLTGRLEIDDQHRALLSNLSIRGNDPGGKLLAGIAQGALEKQNNRLTPLASFSGDQMEIKTVQIETDEELRIVIRFANR